MFSYRTPAGFLLIWVYVSAALSLLYSHANAEEFIQVAAMIQVSSQVSDGKMSIPDILSVAREHNVKVIALSDRDSMRWQYGLWPLRNIIKKTVEDKSINTYGIKRYLSELHSLQNINPDLLIIPGVEAAPFYYWEGSIFRFKLKIKNWHKHIVALGLERYEDMRYLPTIGNTPGISLPITPKSLWSLLWPVISTGMGIVYFLRYPRGFYRLLGIVFLVLGVVNLFNNFPFREVTVDPYHGDLGVEPYQRFIDYVNTHGGLAIWAHPEEENMDKDGIVSIETRPYTEDLRTTHDYTGFTIFYAGYEKVGRPGGVWDDLLMEYCAGQRKHPIWAVGGLGFDYTGDLGDYLVDLRTVLLVRNIDKQDAFDAIREGRMYVVNGKNSSQLLLESFIVKDSRGQSEKTMGEELELIDSSPVIEVKGCLVNSQGAPLSIKLIRNGTIISTTGVNSPFSFSFSDTSVIRGKKYYYRIEVSTSGALLVSNPIFVTPR